MESLAETLRRTLEHYAACGATLAQGHRNLLSRPGYRLLIDEMFSFSPFLIAVGLHGGQDLPPLFGGSAASLTTTAAIPIAESAQTDFLLPRSRSSF